MKKERTQGALCIGSWCVSFVKKKFKVDLHVISTQNDIWQAPTWASVEWSGQWKLLHYFMRRTYEHVLVSPYFLGGSISIYVVVDVANYDISYNLKVDVISWEKVCVPMISFSC